MSAPPFTDVTGIILAGGRGRRMGGRDKGLVSVRGRPMVRYVIDALAPQVGALVINANRNVPEYAAFGFPVVPDVRDGFLGPLAGMLSGMQAACTDYVLTVPCDSPLIHRDLAARMRARLCTEQAEVCVAHDGERPHPVFTLMPRRLHPGVAEFLDAGERKIDRWYARHRIAYADFSDVAETLANVNDEAELRLLEDSLRARESGREPGSPGKPGPPR